jgi:hypothetical protein
MNKEETRSTDIPKKGVGSDSVAHKLRGLEVKRSSTNQSTEMYLCLEPFTSTGKPSLP